MLAPAHETLISQSIIPQAFARMERNLHTFAGQFPTYGDGEHAYFLSPNQNWLASFWAGLLWLRYAYTREASDCEAAKSLLPSFAARLEKKIRLNHDLGFLFTLSARAQYQLKGTAQARDMALKAAEILLGRYRTKGRYIQAWDGEGEEGRFIIDCMMNLPLLFWASQETGDSRYHDAAYAHAQSSQTYLMREKGASYHSFFMDVETGAALEAKTHQGYADDSLWSRGQAWAIYGFSLAAEWTGDDNFRVLAEAASLRYMEEVKPHEIAPWDFRLPEAVSPYPDSSADAIAASGMLRLARLSNNPLYQDFAIQRLDVLHRLAFDEDESAQGLLLHGSQHVPHGYGVDTYTIFGDYFYLEALMRLIDKAPDFWGKADK